MGVFLRVFSLLVLVVVAVSGTVRAQAYPFFVQPLSVKDVRGLSEDMGLSREQTLAVLGQYTHYNERFERLQDEDIRDLLDQAMDMVMEAQWWGGNFSIPERREIERAADRARSIFRTFGRIDDDFFDGMMPLLSEEQAILLERARRNRELDRYQVIHRNILGEINTGGAPNLPRIIERMEVLGDNAVYVHEVLDDHARRVITICKGLETTVLDTMRKVLDEVDRLGLRDMELADMMKLMADEAQIESLKLLFNELSMPIQEAAAKMSRENLRAYGDLLDVLDASEQEDLRTRFMGRGYWQCSKELMGVRNRLERASDLLGDSAGGLEVRDAMATLDDSMASFTMECARAYQVRRAYRTMAMFEDDERMPGQDRVDALHERRDRMVEVAEKVLESHEELLKQSKTAKADEGDGGSAGGGKGREKKDQAMTVVQVEPLDADKVRQIGQWLGADDTALSMMASLHHDYDQTARDMLRERGKSIIAARKARAEADEKTSWWEGERADRAVRGEAKSALSEQEMALFDDLALALPASIDRGRLDRIRAAVERSRLRSHTIGDDWQLRRHTEALVDLTAMILETDPSDFTVDQRSAVLDGLVSYDQAIESAQEELVEHVDKVRSLERRMWQGEGGEEYSPEVQQAMRARWEARRDEVNESASELASLNRSFAASLFESLPEQVSWPLQESYDRTAYPDVYRDERPAQNALTVARDLDDLMPEQIRQLESLEGDYRGAWLGHTRAMVDLKRSGDATQVFPPTRESMEARLAMERHRYQRELLEQRTLVQIELMLDEQQVVQVPGLWNVEESSPAKAEAGL